MHLAAKFAVTDGAAVPHHRRTVSVTGGHRALEHFVSQIESGRDLAIALPRD